MPVPVLERQGLFGGTLFIDGVDSEFYLRCEAVGLRTVLAPDAALNHATGSPAAANVFVRRVCPARPAAEGQDGRRLQRYYYLFRNRILLAQYGRRFPLWTSRACWPTTATWPSSRCWHPGAVSAANAFRVLLTACVASRDGGTSRVSRRSWPAA